jgi:hypothetical protein
MHVQTVRAALAAALLCACGRSAPRVEPSTGPAGVQTATLVVAVSGAGTVFVSGQGAPCAATCRYALPLHTTVQVLATSDPGSAFAGWTGPCSGAGECRFVVEGDAQVAASFARVPSAPLRLSIVIQGQAAGAVRVYDPTWRVADCSQSCTVSVMPGSTSVEPIPAQGSKFLGWTGAVAINARGQILAYAARGGGTHLLLTPKAP